MLRSPLVAHSQSPKKAQKRGMRDFSAVGGGKYKATFSQEEVLNRSLPALGKKNGKFSSVTQTEEERPSHKVGNFRTPISHISTYTDDTSTAYTKPLANRRLPLISVGKKNISIIQKSKSSMDLTPMKRLTETDDYDSEVPVLKQLQQPKSISAGKTPTTVQNETFLEFYFQTMAGYSDGRTKTNQDAYYINANIKRSANCSLFAVFDGHGPLGHRVSEQLKKTLTGKV